MNNNRILYFDIARSVCVIYIICFWHIGDYIGISYPKLFTDITTGVLATFTFLSGLFLSKKRMSICEFYKRRLSRFFFLFLIACITYYMAGSIKSSSQLLLAITGLSCFMPPQPMTLWYFCMLIVFYFITPFILYKANSTKILLARAVSSFIILAFVITICGGDHRIPQYLVFYLLGFFIPLGILKSEKIASWVLIWGALFCVISKYYPSKVCTDFIFPLGVICLLITLAYFLEKVINAFMKKAIVTISYLSMAAYLFHRQWYGIFKIIFMKDGQLLPYFIVPIMIFSLLVVAWCIQYLYDKTFKIVKK